MESDTNPKGVMKEALRLKERYQTVEEDDGEEYLEAWDDVFGSPLNPKQVQRARQEEIDYAHKMHLYTKVPIKEVYQATGKGPISVRWIDINKGDDENPEYRSRWVAREMGKSEDEDLFAATPALDAINMLLSIAVTTGNHSHCEKEDTEAFLIVS